ncbi:isopeptide-forming domain-containing fimbrial protein [Microbacterium sp. NPDC076911]|uniref:isopeptide-forming domain-containing fimbrial protein n=1 Tax=Microbacterium sp. NPDC076911 TaxID=3154958 RepID=UPI00341F22F0
MTEASTAARTARTPVASRRNRAKARRSSALRMRIVAFALSSALILGGAAWFAPAATAAAIPAPTASLSLQPTGGTYGDADEKAFILAGEDATFDVSLQNSSSTPGFNTSFTALVPVGIDFVSSGGMGQPVVFNSGDELPNSAKIETGSALSTVPAGYQLWVFQDVSDLPATAEFASTITVRPDATVFPVGASPDIVLQGYVSSSPGTVPVFDGSTGAGGVTAAENTSSDDASASAPVQALRLTKHEPSPEIELLRGVHDHQTVYTLTVENTPQGETSGVTVVDYLPAGLEFLGCAQVDNTQPSELLFDTSGAPGGTLEYPGASSIVGAGPGSDCITPTSVETVDSGTPASLGAGVYTKVTWDLPALTTGTAQSADLTTAGTPGTYVITYSAAVPLFENTMNFETSAGDATPGAATLGQASNLNNNNGASTRQGQGEGFGDGILYENLATVAGTYAGQIVSGTATTVTDTDAEQIQAMDLRILKSVTTDDGGKLVTGALATYTLDIATSEYTSADQIEITDTLSNGLCPALPEPAAGTPDPIITGTPFPADCSEYSTQAGTMLTGATVSAIDYAADTGSFTVTYVLDPSAMAANDSHEIVYTARMRATYDDDDPLGGEISSGDELDNTVDMSGWTSSVDALDGVTNGNGVAAYGEEDVSDDSSAVLLSNYSAISKRVLPRSDVVPGDITAADSCAVAPAGGWSQNQIEDSDEPFHAGDVVCYELTVNFAQGVDVRNPVVSDFLPVGVSYLDWSLYSGTGIDVATPTVDGQRLEWLVGTQSGEDRFVTGGSTLILHVLAEVTSNSAADAEALYKPQNLMKYQQEDVLGNVFFLRDASEILQGTGPTLLKGVEDVDGDSTRAAASQNDPDGTVFNSDRDGISVAAGDVVTYRIDLSGGDFATENLVVWDALPEGIVASDVTPESEFTAYDPEDAGYPADLESAYSGRSVIVWDGVSVGITPATKTLTYDVLVPASVLAATAFENTASITQFQVTSNTGEALTQFPDDSLDASDRPEGSVVDGALMRDDSEVFTPEPEITKSLVETEIAPSGTEVTDANNAINEAVEGEIITWEYKVVVPANTSVANGVLADRGDLRPGRVEYTIYEEPSWEASALTGATADDFTLSADGELEFPELYTNASDDDQTFTVTLKVYLGDVGDHDTRLTNRATFASDSWSGGNNAAVFYIEPNPTITKSADPSTDVAIDEEITYSLTVSNGPDLPISYDNTVVDTVPDGILVDESTISHSGTLAGADPNTGGGTITWVVSELPETVELTYKAKIEPGSGAREEYVNTAVVTGYTLPEDVDPDHDRAGEHDDDAAATVTTVDAAIAKGVRDADTDGEFTDDVTAPVGDTVEYQVVVTLEPGINYFDPVITDALPDGAVVQQDSIVGPTAVPATGVSGGWDYEPASANSAATWTYLDGASNDIPSADVERVLTLTYQVLLDGADIASTTSDLKNTAAFAWNVDDGDPASGLTIDDSATVTLLDPALSIEKSVSNAVPNPGDVFTYTLSVTNTGDSAAYNMLVTDAVPEGVVVDESSISQDGMLSGSTITWDAADLPGPLAPADSIELTYEATLASSATIGDGQSFVNIASVDHFESFPDNGREFDPTDIDDTATVSPPFPFVELSKGVSGTDIAYAGTPLSWTLTATNTGDGPAQTVTLTDVLPENWTYTAVESVTVAGSAWSGDTTPTLSGSGTTGDPQTLQWTFGTDAPDAPVLAPDQSIVIKFSATPSAVALEDAGATEADGTRVPHVNELAAVTTDTSGADGNADGAYTGSDSFASAYIERADLKLVKAAIGGDKMTVDWIPGHTIGDGYEQPQWQITVTNQGPDAAKGEFTFIDTVTQPDGVTMGAFTARYFADGDSTGVELSVAGAGTAENPLVVGDPTTSLAPDGSDRIVLVADVMISASATGLVENQASVLGRTWETPDDVEKDNEDSDEQSLTPLADLEIEKEATTAEPNAGEPLTWQLAVTNNGPSASVSSEESPITVSDTVPTGISQVADPSNDQWQAATTGGFPATAGDEITWTYIGSTFAVGPSTLIEVTGTVDSSWEAGAEIENTATVAPGVTIDPDPDNNDDSVSVAPGADTMLAIDKTRQVWDGSEWKAATSSDLAVPGTTVTYLIEVANTGTADARNVVVRDSVESYFTYDSYESVDGSWARTSTTAAPGDDQEFTLDGTLAAGDSAALRVTLLLDAAFESGDPVDNTVTASADNATNEPVDTDTTGSERSADLTIDKTHAEEATAGSTVAYSLVATNLGPSFSSGPIEIVDTLPVGFSYAVSTATLAIAGGSPVAVEPEIDGQKLTWTVGDATFSLAKDATIAVSFTAMLDAQLLAGSYTNEADVAGPDDENPLNNHDEDPTSVATLTNLSIEKDVADGPYLAGASTEYTITVNNEGPSVARDVVVTDTAPSGMTITAISGDGWDCVVETFSCESDVLALGTSTITVQTEIDSSIADGADLTNTASVATATPETTTSDNESDETITVTAQADLGITKTAVDEAGTEIAQVDAGAEVRFLLEVHNYGPSDAVGPLTVTDVLPDGLSFVALEPASSEWTCVTDVDDSQVVVCETASGLVADTDASALVLIVAIDPAAPEGSVTNTATVQSPTTEPSPDPHANTDDATLAIVRAVDVSIVKSHAAEDVRIGDELTFDLAVRNEGPSTATEVTVIDTIPAGLTFVDAALSAAGWTVTVQPADGEEDAIVTAVLTGSLAPDTAAPRLALTVEVAAEAYETVTNIATVSSVEPDTNPGDNVSEDTVIVPPQSSLVVTKELVTSLQVGSQASYVITVTNLGPTEDPGEISVTDALPAGLSYVSATGDGVSCEASGETVTCLLVGALGVGESAKITLTVDVGTAAYPEVTNIATVTTPTEQVSGGEITATATDAVAQDPLAATGSSMTAGLLLAALLVLIVGGGLVAIRRRVS